MTNPEKPASRSSLPHAIGVGLFGVALVAGVIQSWREEGRLPALDLLKNGTRERIDHLLKKEDYDSAIHELEMLSAMNPQDAGTHMEVGQLLLFKTERMERMQQARPHFEKVTQLQPNNPEAYYLRGICSGKPEEAARYLQQAIELNPEFGQAYFALGVVHQQLGDLPRAEKCFAKTIELTPNHEPAKLHLAKLREQRKGTQHPAK